MNGSTRRQDFEWAIERLDWMIARLNEHADISDIVRLLGYAKGDLMLVLAEEPQVATVETATASIVEEVTAITDSDTQNEPMEIEADSVALCECGGIKGHTGRHRGPAYKPSPTIESAKTAPSNICTRCGGPKSNPYWPLCRTCFNRSGDTSSAKTEYLQSQTLPR